MKPHSVMTATLLAITSLVTPAIAQNSQPDNRPTSGVQAQLSSEQILQACAQRQAQNLPIPFTDLQREHWAFEAVMNLYYCGPYRGAIPPEQLQRFRQQVRDQG